MRGVDFFALGLAILAIVIISLALTGNYKATWQALRQKYKGGSQLGAMK